MTTDTARALVANALDLTLDEVPENAMREDIEEWDSLAHVRIVLAIEEARGVRLERETMLAIAGLEDIRRLLS